MLQPITSVYPHVKDQRSIFFVIRQEATYLKFFDSKWYLAKKSQLDDTEIDGFTHIRESQHSIWEFINLEFGREKFDRLFNDGQVHYFLLASPDTVKSKFNHTKINSLAHFITVDTDGKQSNLPLIKHASKASTTSYNMGVKKIRGEKVDSPIIFYGSNDQYEAIAKRCPVLVFPSITHSEVERGHLTFRDVINVGTRKRSDRERLVGVKVSPFDFNSPPDKIHQRDLELLYAHPAKFDILNAFEVRPVTSRYPDIKKARAEIKQLAYSYANVFDEKSAEEFAVKIEDLVAEHIQAIIEHTLEDESVVEMARAGIITDDMSPWQKRGIDILAHWVDDRDYDRSINFLYRLMASLSLFVKT